MLIAYFWRAIGYCNLQLVFVRKREIEKQHKHVALDWMRYLCKKISATVRDAACGFDSEWKKNG